MRTKPLSILLFGVSVGTGVQIIKRLLLVTLPTVEKAEGE